MTVCILVCCLVLHSELHAEGYVNIRELILQSSYLGVAGGYVGRAQAYSVKIHVVGEAYMGHAGLLCGAKLLNRLMDGAKAPAKPLRISPRGITRRRSTDTIAVRNPMLQRAMAEEGGVLMDGRDIGTHVLPQADVKIFLTASIEERAQRRYREMREKGYDVELAKLQEDIAARDKADSERAISPLVQAADAVLLDTTGLSIEQVVEKILGMCR